MRYYHGLAGGVPFWEADDVIKTSVESLKLILASGGLYCRGSLKSMGVDIYYQKDNTWNGDDYISLCIDTPGDEEFLGENSGLDSSFFRYARNKIAIEFKSNIEDTCKFREEPYRRLPGERQVYKFISLANVSRILVGIEGIEGKRAIDIISELCAPYNIPVMSFDSVLNEKENIKARKLNEQV